MVKRISVLMGIYNCASTLAEALDSLLAQTYQGFKVIMCDDGSKDNTIEIAQQYVDRYPDKFILIRNERNMGLNYTLNHCLEYADTEYCARMDGDDISVPERFEEELKFLDHHSDIAIVSTPMQYFDETGIFKVSRLKKDKIVSKDDFIKGTPFCHAPSMVRTEAYRKVGGYSVDRKLLRVEDYHLWFKMYSSGYRGVVLKDPMYMMRDDRKAVARRNWRNRVNEFHVRKLGYEMLNIPYHKRIWMLRPLFIALLPTPIYRYFHTRKTK
ncbi:MAG: glycosyltransferase [Bacteroidales bacterium]|nr:glycosyltransferase [Bacteroidales bacterium]